MNLWALGRDARQSIS